MKIVPFPYFNEEYIPRDNSWCIDLETNKNYLITFDELLHINPPKIVSKIYKWIPDPEGIIYREHEFVNIRFNNKKYRVIWSSNFLKNK